MRPTVRNRPKPGKEFQSTHLLRGVTIEIIAHIDELPISIHAPLTRCDCHRMPQSAFRGYFNPRTSYEVRLRDYNFILSHSPFQSTHLLRGATRPRARPNQRKRISIHAPLTRCDVVVIGQRHRSLIISIHAPLTRCDLILNGINFRNKNFNPRTSYEVRQERFKLSNLHNQFQSTHLLRGATNAPPSQDEALLYFNPRTSYEVRRDILNAPAAIIIISIHAPLTRCDMNSKPRSTKRTDHFNPRTSYEVRHCIANLTRKHYDFNPRTSYEVRRKKETGNNQIQNDFNPRTSYEVRRKSKGVGKAAKIYFNPRTSYEVRHGQAPSAVYGLYISIHAPLTRCDSTEF